MTDTTDQFSGQGGSYLVDPATGTRALLERTHDPVFDLGEQEQPTQAPQDGAGE